MSQATLHACLTKTDIDDIKPGITSAEAAEMWR
jgi:hypothetical protein